MSIRENVRVTAVWPSGSPTSSALPLDWGYYGLGTVTISGAWTNAHLGLQVQMYAGLALPLMDWQGSYTGVSIPSATGNVVRQMPDNWFHPRGNNAVLLWSHDGSGSGVPQAAARTVIVDLKA